MLLYSSWAIRLAHDRPYLPPLKWRNKAQLLFAHADKEIEMPSNLYNSFVSQLRFWIMAASF